MKVRNKLKRSMILAAALVAPALIHAEDAPATPVKFDGFVDAYYKFNPNGIQGTGSTVKTFDEYQNMIAVGGGRIGAKSDLGVLDVYFGDYAKVLAGNSIYSTPAVTGNQEQVHVGQAYVAQAFGPVTATLGRFMTHVGFEVADSVSDWNYTRSLLYANVPFFHTGLKLNYAPMEGLGLMVQADDGNSTLFKSDSRGGDGAQISWTGTKDLAIYANYYYDQTLAGSIVDQIHFFDLVTTYTLMDGLDLAGEYLYTTTIASGAKDSTGALLTTSTMTGESGPVPYSPKSQGYALYANYTTPLTGLAVTPRFEAWYTPDAFESKFDYTLTLRYTKGKVVNWLEWRTDVSTLANFAAPPSDPGNKPYMENTLTWATGLSF